MAQQFFLININTTSCNNLKFKTPHSVNNNTASLCQDWTGTDSCNHYARSRMRKLACLRESDSAEKLNDYSANSNQSYSHESQKRVFR